jgi:hypothetical protein
MSGNYGSEEQVDWSDGSYTKESSSNESSSKSSINGSKSSNKERDGMELKLGDIIEISSPSNREYDQKTFLIEYIDDAKIKLINISTAEKHTLTLYDTGQLTDESIQVIALLSRSDDLGYARQNGLVPKKWVDVHFGGEIPTIITGEITNLDEDMIEVTTYPDFEVIYINFEYKGMPEKIPILRFHLRERPASVTGSLAEIYEEDQMEQPSAEKASITTSSSGEMSVHIPENPKIDKNYNLVLDELFEQSNIVFGEEVELEINVEVNKKERRFGLELQLKDLLDELLSTIPTNKRTPLVIERVNTVVRRFKELRQFFSVFDENGNVVGHRNITADYKPLAESLEKMDTNIRWILPVVKNKTKLFNTFEDDSIQNSSIIRDLRSYESKKNINNNQNRYSTFYANIDDDFTPFSEPETRADVLTSENFRVSTDIEAIVDNLGRYRSYGYYYQPQDRKSFSDENNFVTKNRFVIQKYNLGHTKLSEHVMKSGKRIFVREPMTQNDKIAVKSVIMLPHQAVEFSRVDLPNTNIMNKTSLSHNWLYHFKLLNKNMSFQTKMIEDLEEEVFYETEAAKNFVDFVQKKTIKFLDSAIDYDISQKLLKEENIDFHSLLNAVIPNTRMLIQLLRGRATAYNFKEAIQYFEPFHLSADNITYTGRTRGIKNNEDAIELMSGRGGPYQEIRTYIKELINAYKTSMEENRKKYEAMASKRYDDSGSFALNPIYKNFVFNDEYLKMVATRYKLDSEDSYKNQKQYKSSSELLNSVLVKDNGAAYSAMISLLMSPLYTPNLSTLITIAEDGAIKSSSKTCVTRVVAKKYTSIRDLQKDNDISEDIYFDKEYDNTPYAMVAKYAEDRKKMLAEDFAPYLKANLLEKHDANPATVDDLVKTLIAGKKKVSDGNYAMLVEYPKLEKTFSEEDLTAKEKRSVEIEADAKKKTTYYVRKRGNWTHADEPELLNNDTLCYSDDSCVVDKKECLSKDDSFSHMKKIAQNQAMKEYDQATIEKTMEDLEKDMKARALYYMDLLKKKIWLADSRVEQYDFYARNMGKHAVKLDFVVSPYEVLRDLILEQSDFAKQQSDILVFRDRFCRDAVVNEYSKELPYWLYCVDTDTKLLPRFIYELALKYSIGADYGHELELVCSRIGRLSDDGESIVDKNTGYKIKSIDFMAVDEYNDAGFKIVSHEVMGQAAGDALKDAINDEISEMSYTTADKSFKVFENELTQTVYNIARALCGYMHIDVEPIEGVILANAIRLLNANLYSPEKYKKIEELNAKKNVSIPSYPTYKNQNIVFFSAATTFVAIQTMIPAFKPSKTFPGCVFSFGGYPLDGGMEYTPGLKYMSCVIQKIIGNVEPWNSIKHLKRDGIMKRLVEYVGKILKEPEVEELYTKKKTYLILFPDDAVPEVHNVSKWRAFQPPIVPFSIVKSLKTVSEEFKDELAISFKSGHKNQHAQLGVIYNKIIQYSYAVVESVNKIVEEGKEALLKAGTIIFLENACCEEKEQRASIQFFINKNPNIEKYLDFIRKNSAIMDEIKMMSRAAYISPGTRTMSLLSTSNYISEENIYTAFIHYCKLLNKQSLVPDDMRIFFQEKPGGMQPQWDLNQTIDHLKKLGKKFDIDSLKQLMQIVAKRNTIHGISTSATDIQYTRAFSDLVARLSASETPVIEPKLTDYLKIILDKFDINRPVDKDLVTMEKMKKHLSRANRQMRTEIMGYINEFGTTRTLAEKTRINSFLENLTAWDCDTNMKPGVYTDEGQYKVIQYIKNAVFMITKTVPAIITNSEHGTRKVEASKHWDLSEKHMDVLQGHIDKYFDKLHSYVKDNLICRFFRDINMKLVDLNLFLNYIPVFTAFINEDKLYYLLFDKEALYLLHSYCYYSVLYEIVTGSDTDEYLKLDMEEVKNMRKIMKTADNSVVIGTADEEEDPSEYPDEVDISAGNRMEFRQRVCDLLMIMIEMDMLNKKTVDKPYEDLLDKSYNESKREKATITDYLKNMTIEERRVENILKAYKMGRWNLGEQKGVYKYDQNLYDSEKAEEGDLYAVREDQPEEVDPEHNDYDPNAEAEREAEDEENNIDGLDEDYMDGVYYQEDRDE